jgi:hypothetical protein
MTTQNEVEPKLENWRNTQQETITWHKYPEEKPPKRIVDEILITYIFEEIVWTASASRYEKGSFWFREDEINLHVIAWAEMPKGWKK